MFALIFSFCLIVFHLPRLETCWAWMFMLCFLDCMNYFFLITYLPNVIIFWGFHIHKVFLILFLSYYAAKKAQEPKKQKYFDVSKVLLWRHIFLIKYQYIINTSCFFSCKVHTFIMMLKGIDKHYKKWMSHESVLLKKTFFIKLLF